MSDPCPYGNYECYLIDGKWHHRDDCFEERHRKAVQSVLQAAREIEQIDREQNPDIPPNTDMRIEREELADGSMQSVTITAHTEQARIDLAMEYPRIVKLLSRDWLADDK